MHVAQLIYLIKNDKILKNINFGGVFVKTAQKKTSEARLRASKKYSNSKWRPNIYLDMNKREPIERWFTGKGYRSFNEYVIALIDQDIKGSNQDSN